MNSYEEQRFRRKVDAALLKVQTVLTNTRCPTYPEDVPHQYSDKYTLTETIVRTACTSFFKSLGALGLSAEGLAELKALAEDRTVTLRFKAEERCTFMKKVVREEESKVKHVTEVRSTFGSGSIASKTVTTITEYLWDYHVAYEILAYKGASPEEGAVALNGRSGSCVLTTSSENTPRPAVVVKPSVDVDITWLLARLEADNTVNFRIDRTVEACRTPRRNLEVEAALRFTTGYGGWMQNVHDYFRNGVFPLEPKHGLDLSALTGDGVFVPVLPLFEEGQRAPAAQIEAAQQSIVAVGAGAASAVDMSLADTNTFLEEESRSLNEKLTEVASSFPANEKLVTVAEGTICVIALHTFSVAQSLWDGVEYVEDMLRKGLIAAIGKVVTPLDFTQYMNFHNRRLFRDAFCPRPFSFAVRRPEHYPEGIVSIEADIGEGGGPQPVPTVARHIADGVPMHFSLDASTRVTFGGERYLHSLMFHRFSDGGPVQMVLSARARQFSSFIMLVGRIGSATLFEPKAAVVIRNKDDLKIPLMLEEIPAPKAFKDAIEALSPEQQRFAKAYRKMQLSATLFGICIIQIKPQMENLLCLPADALTKEIELTQELMDLFIKYQIPSDQLKFDGDEAASPAAKVAVVKAQVKAMQDMLQRCKLEELEEQKRRQEMSKLQARAVDLSTRSDRVVQREAASSSMFSLFSSSKMEQCSAPAPAPMLVPQAAPIPEPAGGEGQAAGGEGQAEAGKADVPREVPEGQQPNEVSGAAAAVDVSSLPGLLDARFEKFDEDAAVRPTIINMGDLWSKKSYKTLLSSETVSDLRAPEQEKERNTAYDLLDSLSRSGSLAVDAASLHVIVAATHTFDQTLMNTIVQNNVNPIEKVERSVLISASVVHDTVPVAMIARSEAARVGEFSPKLMEADYGNAVIEE